MTYPVRFGLNVDPSIGGLRIAERIIQIAGSSGLVIRRHQDHPYHADFVDTLSLITCWRPGARAGTPARSPGSAT